MYHKFIRSVGVIALIVNCQMMAFAADKAPTPAQQQQMMQQQQQMMRQQLREDLRSRLKITKDQEDSFNKFVTAMEPTDAYIKRQEDLARSFGKAKTMIEQMEIKLAASKEQEKVLTSNIETVKAFYALLTPEQRKAFDDLGKPPSPPAGKRPPKK